MFDAKSMLENIVRGAAPANSSTPTQPNGSGQPNGGSIGDILNDILRNAGGGSGASAQTGAGSGGGFGDILNQIGRSLSQAQAQAPGATQTSPPSGQTQPGQMGGTSGSDLQSIFEEIKNKLGQAGGSVTGSGGSIGDILSNVLTQATQGVREGSARIGNETGASDALGRLASDPQAAQILGKLKDFIQNNPYSAGAAAGGLGGLLLGTSSGRSVAAGAAKLGAIAMIGGLAYKALQNYQAGKPLITGATPSATEVPPTGSGFEPAAVTNDAAVNYVQAMIAAAAADGRIDASEHEKIISGLSQAGLDRQSEEFLANELNNPKSVEELAASCATPQEACQLYTAARIAISDNSPAEAQFLSALASALRLDPRLTAQIDATARAAA
ncbi:tellurite resistance TerB family protein [Hyphomicrobium sp. 99]|uniref:tellurite resistance TerB family protein n=1 Tax=Hyphomicrobium sp. 99 TaxID=1163419 RepID=UPI0005F81DAC|nr:tellurite resistance TerB family protein [Hyphomicrobium sp. 99]